MKYCSNENHFGSMHSNEVSLERTCLKKNQNNGFDKDEFDDNEKTTPNNQPPFEAHSKPMISPPSTFYIPINVCTTKEGRHCF
jgi:hypothetical protein